MIFELIYKTKQDVGINNLHTPKRKEKKHSGLQIIGECKIVKQNK